VENLRDALDGHAHAYVFTYANMRTSHFKDMRSELAGAARFFLGKNRVMQKALAGADGADEHRPGLASLAADLRGPVGLLLTSKPRAEVEAFFAAHAAPDYARAGAVADRDVVVPRGKLELPHTMVDELRKLGMTGLKLDKGVPTLPLAYTICSSGESLTPEQCRLLKHFGHQLSVFRLRLVSQWTAAGGAYERIASAADGGAAAGGDDDEDMDGDDGSDDE
jgi:mRNA turnover protein 4